MAVESRYQQGSRSVDFLPGRWQVGTPQFTHTVTSTVAGFGIAQWTFPDRKEALLDFAGNHWGSFAMELAFVAHELKHPVETVGGRQVQLLVSADTLDRLQHARSIEEATAVVMALYEQPASSLEVPTNFPSVNQVVHPIGPNPHDPSGYFARLTAARKIREAYG